MTDAFRPLQIAEQPAPVRQTDFTAGSGNALQACVASLFHLDLEKTPNFVTLPNYEQGIKDFVQPSSYTVRKRKLPSVMVDDTGLCILRGKSPRGNFGHVVVARCLPKGEFEMIWDPHPDETFLDPSEPHGWYMVFEKGTPETAANP